MFERGKDIREAIKAELLEQGIQLGVQQGIQLGIQISVQQGVQQGIQLGSQNENQRIKKLLESRGVTLPPELAEEVFGKAPPNSP